MAHSFFRKKPLAALIADSAQSTNELKRTLGKVNLIALGIGAIIGAGIFVLIGQAAAFYAGPAVSISFIIAAIACAFAGLCYAEIASMIPVSGSAYAYAYVTLGRGVAWIIGWALIMEYLFAASTVAVGWSGYLVSLLDDAGIHIPAELSSGLFEFDTHGQFHFTGAIINLPAVLIIFAISLLLIRGIKESATFNNIAVALKLAVVFAFIIFGWKYIQTDNWTPFIPENKGSFGTFGVSGVLRASAVIFFAFIGFDAVSTAAQEARNPQRDMPWGILGSLVICTIVYVLIALVMTGIAPYAELNTPAPIALAIDKAGPGLRWLSPLIKIGAIGGLGSVILVMLMGQSRIFYSMSKDGLFFKPFSRVHAKFGTPNTATIITGIAASVIAGLFPIDVLSELVSTGTLLAFVIVCIGVIILRYKQPDLTRPFKTPWFPVTPVLGIISCVTVMCFLHTLTFIISGTWLVIGLILYAFYGRKHAKY